MDLRELSKLPESDLSELLYDLEDDDVEKIRTSITEFKDQQKSAFGALTETITKYRAEAIAYRTSSGIEEEWRQDEEYYQGIDEATGNQDDWNSKPPGTKTADDEHGGSTLFLNITRPYCDAAAASLADMLLPTDDGVWQIKPTPVPMYIKAAEGKFPAGMQAHVEQNPGMGERFQKDASAKINEAKNAADKAQTKIEDWQTECNFLAQMRRVIEDAARVGTGVLKGPVMVNAKTVNVVDGEMVETDSVVPASQWISYQNLYPAKGCGQDIHSGGYIFERDDISAKKLRELRGLPGYLDDEINQCLDEGPTEAGSKVMQVGDMKRDTSSLFEIWYYHGEITQEELEAAFDLSGNEDDEEEEKSEALAEEETSAKKNNVVQAQLTMVNNRLVRVVLNALETGDFPYDMMVWQRRADIPQGIGLARQIRAPQQMILGASRNLMDNAGLAGGPMWAMNEEIIVPIDGIVEVKPRKGFRLAYGATADDITKGFTYFAMDAMIDEMQSIINMALKMAEDVTGLPMIMQGQMGQKPINTLGQTELLNNNANIVRRRIARLFDDLVTEPHVTRYYQHWLQDAGDDAQGADFKVHARGSSNLVERSVRYDNLNEMLEMSQNPVFKIDPQKVGREMIRTRKLNPKDFEYDDEEWQKIVEKMGQPPPDPRIEQANIREQGQTQRTQMTIEAAGQRDQGQAQQKEMLLQADMAKQDKDLQFKGAMEAASNELAQVIAEMKYQGDKDINQDTLKVKINETLQRLAVQQRLAGMGPAPQVARPEIEPPGRAENGHAFEQ